MTEILTYQEGYTRTGDKFSPLHYVKLEHTQHVTVWYCTKCSVIYNGSLTHDPDAERTKW